MTHLQARPEPGITLTPAAAEQHHPVAGALPAEAGPAIRCSCGVAIYAASASEVAWMWRSHLVQVAQVHVDRIGKYAGSAT